MKLKYQCNKISHPFLTPKQQWNDMESLETIHVQFYDNTIVIIANRNNNRFHDAEMIVAKFCLY